MTSADESTFFPSHSDGSAHVMHEGPTLVDHLDQLLLKRARELRRARAFNALALLVAAGGLFVACHPWP